MNWGLPPVDYWGIVGDICSQSLCQPDRTYVLSGSKEKGQGLVPLPLFPSLV